MIPPRITIQNIIYQDTVLSLKDLGKNLKITSISNIEEFFLEKCLKTILEANPNVTFNTVQYSRQDKKVYFYTNNEISIKEWEDRNVLTYNKLSSAQLILEEVKKILVAEKNHDSDCISIYDIAKLIKEFHYKYDNLIKLYNDRLNYSIHSRNKDLWIGIHDFDFKTNELRIGLKKYDESPQEISFTKANNDLYITKSKSYWSEEVFPLICSTLSELYDEIIKFSGFENDYCYNLPTINSKFHVDISSYGVNFFDTFSTNMFIHDFQLSSLSFKDKYECICNSSTVIETIKGEEDEIFNRIFVKIEDCPKWCQPLLYETRKIELQEEEQEKMKQQQQKQKKQKRLALKRKLFSFLKK